MIFSRVVGGPDVDNPRHREIKLHQALLSFLQPSGSLGTPDSNQRVVNYRNKLDKFNKERGGREYLTLAGAVWEYYRGSILSIGRPDTIGNLDFQVRLIKLPKAYPGNNVVARTSSYVKEFLDEFLEGPEGRNTARKDNRPPNAPPSSLLVEMPKDLKTVDVGDSQWVYFQLKGFPHRGKHTDYYFTLLNDDFALSVEFKPSASHQKARERKQVEASNQEAMDMIISSLKLEFD